MEFEKIQKGIFNPVNENREKFKEAFGEKLSELFPSAMSEDEIDFRALLAELGEYVDNEERYGLNWAGKMNAKKIANEDVVARTLKYVPEDSKNPDETENLYIEGDNLEVLKLLRNSYYNKVKMIYIDPPYNTGNDFIYNDKFSKDARSTELEEGDISEEERYTVNQKSSGKYHSNWLNMMYPRLRVAKDLLTEDGVIFISIDDNEVDNLKKVCNEVFGEENFLENLVWKRRATPPNDRIIGKNHEYILVYSKNIEEVRVFLQPRDPETDSRYKNPDNDSRGRWVASDLSANGKGGRLTESCIYPIINPKTNEQFMPPQNKCWLYNSDKMKLLIEDNRIGFREKTGTPFLKRYLSEVRQGNTLPTILDNFGFSQDSAKEIKKIFSIDAFEFTKPIKLIKALIHSGSINQDIILDFFSGSSTTAHAVMQLNAEDGGNRKFIMVQLPEETDEKSEAYKAGYNNICEIGKERIRRAGEKILEENADKEGTENLDVGFKVFRTGDTNIRWISDAIENDHITWDESMMRDKDRLDFNPGYTDMDVVYEILLRHRAIPLSARIERLSGIGERTYLLADAILVCLDESVTEEMVDRISEVEPLPSKIIFRDSAFGDDISLKENTMVRLQAQMKKQSGVDKKAYRIEFI